MLSSIVKFCEPKFLVTNYIYEFFNTISNIPYILIGYYNYDKNPRLKYSYLSLLGVGVGSTILHGTGTYIGQILDEFFMLAFVVNTLSLYPCINKFYLSCYNFFLGGLYIYFKIYSIFLILFTSQVIVLIMISYFSAPKNSQEYRMVVFGISMFITGKLLWDLEQNFCDKIPFFKWFHPVWHLLSAFSSYFILESNEILHKRINHYTKKDER